MSTPLHFINRHGDHVRGDLHLPTDCTNAPVVIICHGFKGFKDWGGFPFAAEYLATQGLACIRFNFSLNGIEEHFDEFTALGKFARNTISRELDDLHDLVDAVRNKGLIPPECDARRIGLIGHSLGGGVAVVHASEDARIRAVASWAGVADFMRWGKKTRAMWKKSGRMEIENVRTHQMMPMDVVMLEDLEANRTRFDIPAAARRLRVPLLVVHGEQDLSVPIDEGRRVAAAADAAHTRLIQIPNSDHTFGVRHPFEGPTAAFTTVLESTAAFFRDVFDQD